MHRSWLLLLTVPAPLLAQDPTPPQSERTPRIVVTATRAAEDPLETPYSSESLDAEKLRRRAYRTTPQALRDLPGVMVQETAHGHGSPYIRGFTSFRNLFLVDGVRLNNSGFRPGPNQYWNTVDPLSIERLEIVKGPGSVLYGSDAIGGTVQVITRSPTLFPEQPGVAFGGSSYVRYATAEDSIQGRAELQVGYRLEGSARTGVLLGGDAKAFGDLEGGSGVGVQPGTGYDETAVDLKVEHWFDDDTRLVFLHQNVAQEDVPRTHSTVHGITWRGLSSGSDLRRELDQDRTLTYLQLHKERIGGALDTLRASLSWHRQEETRDRIRSNGNQEFQGFDIGTLGAWLQFESPTGLGALTYGVDYYHDDVDSFFRRVQNPRPEDGIQGPIADDASYDLLGFYVQDRIDLNDDVELLLGGRFTHAAADADSVRDPSTNAQIALEDDWDSFVGNARVLWRAIPDRLHAFAGVAQGFRAPNLSDLTRFDAARSNEFEIPATQLEPEDYVSYEVGVKVEDDDLSLQTAYFYTDIQDQILRFPTGNVNASGESEVTKANVGDGHVYGVELGFAYRVIADTTVFGNATYMEGRVTNFENGTLQETYLTRLMPFTAQLGLRYDDPKGRFWAEGAVIRAEDADKLSFGDLRDTSRIPPGGTPSYTVAHLRAGVDVGERAAVTVLLENLTDEDYRVHGSGLNRPGRNLVVAFQSSF